MGAILNVNSTNRLMIHISFRANNFLIKKIIVRSIIRTWDLTGIGTMSIRYKIIHEKKLVYVLGENKITHEDLFQHWETLARDPLYVAPMKKLIDYRKCDRFGPSSKHIEEYIWKKVRLLKKFKGEISVVIVNNDLDFGTSRMFGAHLGMHGLEMNVVRSLGAALKILDVALSDMDVAFD
jgi:hypothetical protein